LKPHRDPEFTVLAKLVVEFMEEQVLKPVSFQSQVVIQ